MSQQPPSIGRIVHYRLESGRNAGEYRPAIIVRVWTDPDGKVNPRSLVQLQVFTDGSNDDLPCPYWATSRQQGDQNGQWKWPEYVAPTTPALVTT